MHWINIVGSSIDRRGKFVLFSDKLDDICFAGDGPCVTDLYADDFGVAVVFKMQWQIHLKVYWNYQPY